MTAPCPPLPHPHADRWAWAGVRVGAWPWAWSLAALISGSAGALGSAQEADHADIRFLSRDQGRVAIIDDSDDPYFERLQPQEMGAKTTAGMPNAALAWQRSACRTRYQDAVRTFTPEEQVAVARVVNGAYPFLRQHYPLFAAEPWRFIKLEHRFEGDHASTRGHVIVLTEGVLHALLEHAPTGFDLDGTETLIAAQSHVLQRYHRALFATLYGEVWGFVHLPKPPLLPFECVDHQCLSPDAIDRDWAYPVTVGTTTLLLQVQVFLRSTSSMPSLEHDCDSVVMPLEAHADGYRYVPTASGHAQLWELSTVQPYLAAFAPATHLVHPNDIESELFARLVASQIGGHPIDPMPKCLAQLAAWAASDHGFVPGASGAK